MNPRSAFLPLVFLLAPLTPVRAQPPREAGSVDFDRDIRPILADKCFRCHGPDEKARQAGLRLDLRESATAPTRSKKRAVVAGQPADSELIRRVTSTDPNFVMPPPESKLALKPAQKELLASWIAAGAPYTQHWSFRPLRRPSLPEVERDDWPRNAIDHFILARLEREGLEPSPRADSARLGRRVSLDLLGLPPSPRQADALATDASPAAYAKLVERSLASPAFGERMAWDWLDAARYADSNGYQGDQDRTMWPWRDWVVEALNHNLPYDRFTVWQLAGDLLPDATFEQRLATGFCRNHMINGEGGRIPEENRVDYVMDMTETTGTVWLGLTLTCCRCHDHKYDPLKRREYYSLFAFFNQTPVNGGGGDPRTAPTLAAPTSAQRQELERFAREIDERRGELREAESSLLAAPSADDKTVRETLPEEIRKLHDKPVEKRSPDDLSKLEKHWSESAADYVTLVRALREALGGRERVRKAMPLVMVMADRSSPRQTFLLDKGLYNKRQDEVTSGVPGVLPPFPAAAPANRLGLARWLVSPDHPLTARVTVNRVWELFFGRGLVKTTEDFGAQGERPSHPELLDWLAYEFVDCGWDLKRLCRLIVSSATYQQSSLVRPDLHERDPDNRLLARGPRYRLPSWMIRDHALAISGLLVRRIGGPPVNSYQPDGVWADATFGKKKYRRDSDEKLYRRSLYTFWRRIVAPTLFFDSASRQTCTVRKSRTNTPLHALTTLNDITYVEAARVLAQDLLSRSPGESSRHHVRTAFRQILVRSPTAAEERILVASIEELNRHFAADVEAAKALIEVGESPGPEGADPIRLAALTALCNSLLNLDEALSKE